MQLIFLVFANSQLIYIGRLFMAFQNVRRRLVSQFESKTRLKKESNSGLDDLPESFFDILNGQVSTRRQLLVPAYWFDFDIYRQQGELPAAFWTFSAILRNNLIRRLQLKTFIQNVTATVANNPLWHPHPHKLHDHGIFIGCWNIWLADEFSRKLKAQNFISKTSYL